MPSEDGLSLGGAQRVLFRRTERRPSVTFIEQHCAARRKFFYFLLKNNILKHLDVVFFVLYKNFKQLGVIQQLHHRKIGKIDPLSPLSSVRQYRFV